MVRMSETRERTYAYDSEGLRHSRKAISAGVYLLIEAPTPGEATTGSQHAEALFGLTPM